jgi:hypothetical protein
MAKPSQTLAQRALLFPYSRDLAFRLPVRNLTVHGIDCRARLGHSVAVFAIVDLADGLPQMDADTGSRTGIKRDGYHHGKGRGC